MDILIEIFDKIKQLREKGVKMKDIAEEVELGASVLSSLYSTVLPSYISEISQGVNEEEALDHSLQLVNNVSKKKLLACVDLLKTRLSGIEPKFESLGMVELPFFEDVKKESIGYVANVSNYTGVFYAYSRSSYKDGLKVEPYWVCDVAEGETLPRVACKNAMGQLYWGTALFSTHQNGYMFFNEQKRLQLVVKTIFLQLPMFDHPEVLKGMYLSHDYNRNPIARRVLFIKQKEMTSMEDFDKLKTYVVEEKEMTEEEKHYYRYTCQEGDYIRSFMMASPESPLEELEREKIMLKI